MAIIRVNKNRNYTTISKYHLQDKNLSLKAKGLLSMMLSLPDDWDYSVRGLSVICKETKDTINGILNELEKNNYLERKKIYINGKISEWEYNIFEEKNLYPKNQDIENQDIAFYDNNKIINNKKLNNKEKYISKDILKERYFINNELNDLFIEFLKQRQKLKAINSERAIKQLLAKLEPYDDLVKEQMIEESLVNSWKGLFPIKKQKEQKKDEWWNKYEN